MKLVLISCCCMLMHFAKAQNIVAAEYFVDTDPGLGNGTAIPVTPGTTASFTATVPVSSLSAGFHFLAIRSKDATGKWGFFESRGIYISNSTANVANITAAEYFIDTDPGVGNGIALSAPSGTTSTFVATIPTASLAAGFHFLSIRTKDADGKWGFFENRGFYISTSTANVANITAAEFFIDTDPGVGNGTALTIPSGSTSAFVSSIPTTSLAAGFHFLAIRTKDVSGKWGFFENRGFYISNSGTNVPAITAAEYFIDTDPGVGNGIALSVPSGNTSTFVASISTGSLSAGFHFIAIRTKDGSGRWGFFENRMFYISPASSNMAAVVSGEYFFDTDPGAGNGQPFTFTTPGTTVNQVLNLVTPVGLGQGAHVLVMRVKDANNIWGLFDTAATINISGTIPLKLLSFRGRKDNRNSLLEWTTDNEQNTSHFIIERSRNGISFSSIGSVPSNNRAGVNNYSFTDQQPFDGINFYRLKQVDLDGKFTYSPIIRILFDGFGTKLVLYPSPVTDMLNIDFAGKQKTVLINLFDAQGKLVQRTTLANQSPLKLNVEQLPKGSYTIQLSDGEMISTGNFIKQ